MIRASPSFQIAYLFTPFWMGLNLRVLDTAPEPACPVEGGRSLVSVDPNPDSRRYSPGDVHHLVSGHGCER
jgi:hypothetical protein